MGIQSIKWNHIYFTALINGAGLAAALAKGDGHERVYIVEPTGGFENAHACLFHFSTDKFSISYHKDYDWN